jgi:hypothetical protein
MASTKPSASRRPSPDGLTRSQVARQLGVGITAVHHMRLRGELRPTRDAAGAWRYDPADVIRAAAKRGIRGLHTQGDVAAEAFRMFDQGGELREIVSALRVTPDEVRRLYRDWQSSLDDPPPMPDLPGARLLDQEPGADEAFARLMAQAAALADPPSPPKPKK